MITNIDEIKIALFNEVRIWDDATSGECEETSMLLNYYNLWNKVAELGWCKEYFEFIGA